MVVWIIRISYMDVVESIHNRLAIFHILESGSMNNLPPTSLYLVGTEETRTRGSSAYYLLSSMKYVTFPLVFNNSNIIIHQLRDPNLRKFQLFTISDIKVS